MLLNLNNDDQNKLDEDEHHMRNSLDESEFYEDMKLFEQDKGLEFEFLYKYGLRIEWSFCHLFQKCA